MVTLTVGEKEQGEDIAATVHDTRAGMRGIRSR